MSTLGPAGAALASTAATVASAAMLRPLAAGRSRWTRRNFRGSEVSLVGGPAVAVGALSSVALAGSSPAVVAGLTAGALGLYDDVCGDSHARGLRGHVRALSEGRVTTGLVKLVGLVGGGAAASVVHRGRLGGATVVDAALVAGTANLVNLLDLRPGRALKALLLIAPPLGARGAETATTAAVIGAAAAMLPADLSERVMIGDCGANTLGALVGWAAASGLGRGGRVVTLGAVVALTLASERVSFTEVIASTPWLDAIDRWGRR